jgi:hypothetical protein
MNVMRFTIQPKRSNADNETQQAVVISRPIPIDRNLLNPIQVKPKENKMKWGAPIWYLFHTLSYKVKESEFLTIKNQLLANIVSICKNLPCPTCAAHATEYLSNINFNTIKTKEDVKMLFFTFHNVVNKKKGYPIFTYEEFESKYSKANTVNIINYFLNSFQTRTTNVRYISDDLHRRHITTLLQNWLSGNVQYYDP